MDSTCVILLGKSLAEALEEILSRKQPRIVQPGQVDAEIILTPGKAVIRHHDEEESILSREVTHGKEEEGTGSVSVLKTDSYQGEKAREKEEDLPMPFGSALKQVKSKKKPFKL